MITKELLFKKLQDLNISSQTYEHKPLFTCEEALKYIDQLPPHGPIKNLFLIDKKKQYWLVVALHSTQIQLKELATNLPAPGLRFAGPDDLLKYLGVTPGSVTPFALMNDTEHAVNIILDEHIFEHDVIGVHPLLNDATTLLSPQDLATFITSCGNHIRSL